MGDFDRIYDCPACGMENTITRLEGICEPCWNYLRIGRKTVEMENRLMTKRHCQNLTTEDAHLLKTLQQIIRIKRTKADER